MKKMILNPKKSYILRPKGSRAICDIELYNITLTSSEINYWTFENLNMPQTQYGDGIPYEIYTVIPRIAGCDYYVDNGGEIIKKTVYVPKGDFLRLHPDLSLNPSTGECIFSDGYIVE